MCTKQNDQSDMFQGTGPKMRVARLKWRKLPVSASRHNSHKWKKNHSLTKFRFRLRTTENTFVLNRTKKWPVGIFKNSFERQKSWKVAKLLKIGRRSLTRFIGIDNFDFLQHCTLFFFWVSENLSIIILSSHLSWANISSTWGGRLSTVVAFALRSQA